MTWLNVLYAHRNPHAEAAVTSASGTSALIHDQLREAARQPTETPRKHAISTMLVKNVKNMTVLPSQRMHASSKKRMKKLIKKSSMLARTAPGRDGEVLGCSGVCGADTTVTGPPRCGTCSSQDDTVGR